LPPGRLRGTSGVRRATTPSSLTRRLVFEFQDLEYAIDNTLRSLTFAFASTDYAELVGVDSVKITREPAHKKR